MVIPMPIIAIEAPSTIQVEAQTVSAYDALAPEYESNGHKTTRILESLSCTGLKNLFQSNSIIFNSKRILEVGCGTGVISKLILQFVRQNTELIFSDASPRMLEIAKSQTYDRRGQKFLQYKQVSVLSSSDWFNSLESDLIVCGLGDPYFVKTALLNLRQACASSAFLAVTLPEYSWAITERTYKLKLPHNLTRFQLCSGETVYPFSFTYSESDLEELLFACGFESMMIWSETSYNLLRHHMGPSLKAPATICALARAI
jgi:hypothetical protein